MICTIAALLVAFLIYPLAVLCVAITGPHSEFEKAALRDRDASLAEDAERLSPEGVAARAEGIAQ